MTRGKHWEIAPRRIAILYTTYDRLTELLQPIVTDTELFDPEDYARFRELHDSVWRDAVDQQISVIVKVCAEIRESNSVPSELYATHYRFTKIAAGLMQASSYLRHMLISRDPRHGRRGMYLMTDCIVELEKYRQGLHH